MRSLSPLSRQSTARPSSRFAAEACRSTAPAAVALTVALCGLAIVAATLLRTAAGGL